MPGKRHARVSHARQAMPGKPMPGKPVQDRSAAAGPKVKPGQPVSPPGRKPAPTAASASLPLQTCRRLGPGRMPASRRARRPGRRGGSSVWTRRSRRKRVCRFRVGLRGSDRRSRGGRLAGCSGSSDLEKARMNADRRSLPQRPPSGWWPSWKTCRSPAIPIGCGWTTRSWRGRSVPGQFVMIRPGRRGRRRSFAGTAVRAL